MKLLSHVRLFAIPCTVAYEAPLSMEFSRQEYWSGVPLPSPYTSWKKIFHANRDQKKAGVAILISDRIDFKTKAVKRNKEGHYIMIKGSIQEEDITIINIYAPNIGALQYIRQMLTSMKGEINNNTIIVGDFNTPLTPMNQIRSDQSLSCVRLFATP